MTKYNTRKTDITYSKRRQRCETDSWWQTVPRIYHTVNAQDCNWLSAMVHRYCLICSNNSW